MKVSIETYGDKELVLIVANNEGLYLIRHTDELMPTLDELYWYTDEQLQELEEYLEQDKEETEDE